MDILSNFAENLNDLLIENSFKHKNLFNKTKFEPIRML